MKYSIFGEMRPENRDEIGEALNESGMSDGTDLIANIDIDEEGCHAEVITQDGESVFNANDWKDKETLEADLTHWGITEFNYFS